MASGWKKGLVLAACGSLLGCSESGGGTSETRGPRELFAFPSRFSIGSGFPVRLVRGDLDGDQVTDLVVPLSDFSGSQRSSTVALAFLNREGLPVRREELADARQPNDAAVSDFNGDGRADVAVLDGHGEVLVHLQKNDGDFEAPLPFAVGEGPSRLIVGRWNGDAVDDLLAMNTQGSSVCVLPGNGDGTFEPARFTTVNAFGLRDAAAGDFDQDGALDLAVITFNEGLVLFGAGNGRFGEPQTILVGSSMSAVRVADVTGDTFLDIVATDFNTRLLGVMEGDGARGFTPGFQFSVGVNSIGTVEIGDLDRDGVVDLALGTNLGITPLLGLGGGDFSPGLPFSPGGSQIEFALGDIDDDLDLDLVSALVIFDGSQSESIVTVLKGEGDGTFVGPCAYDAGPNARSVVIGDLVSDGVPDLAVLCDPQSVSVLGGLGNGSFAARIETPLARFPNAIFGFELDGNTLEDLLVTGNTFFQGDLTLLSSNGAGSFDAPVTFPSGGIDPTAVRLADLDGDLFHDLVVCNRISNQIAVHLGESGGFSKPLRFGVGSLPSDLELADLDGDGILDAAAANHAEDTVSVLIGNGDGFFRPDVPFPTLDGPQDLEIGDFDEDGIDDLMVVNVGESFSRSQVILLSGFGGGSFGDPQILEDLGDANFRLVVADLNRDGRLDLVTSSFGGLLVHVADGPASFVPPQVFAASAGIGGAGIADLDADGKKDIAVATNGQALVFLNQGP